MPYPTETIAIPVTKGIDVNTEARLVQPPALLEATNSRFPRAGGATKRRGHAAYPVLGPTAVPLNTSVPENVTSWVYGAGYTKNYTLAAGTSYDSTTITPDYPNNRFLYGASARDTESLVWNGHLMYSYSPAQLAQTPPVCSQVKGSAVMPSLVASPIAKVAAGQIYPDYTDNGVIKLVVWLDTNNLVYYAVYDSVTNATIVAPTYTNTAGAGVVTAYSIRCLSLGAWVHLLISDSSNTTLQLFSLNQNTPRANFTQRSLGACNSHFDVYKVDETQALVIKSNDPYIDTQWIGADGSGANNGLPTLNTIPLTGPFLKTPVIKTVGGSYNSHAGVIGICYGVNVASSSACSAYFVGINATTGAFLNVQLLTGLTVNPIRVSAANKYYDSTGAVFDCYWETRFNVVDGVPTVYRQRVNSVTGVTGAQTVKSHQSLASRAFSVGNRTFIWTGHNTTLQSTWFLLDEDLAPVGHLDFGVANCPTLTSRSFLASINFVTSAAVDTYTHDQTKVHLALGYRVRVPATSTTTGVFSEPSIKTVVLDFLPKLRSAQAGRSTYFAGAQVWSYDGVEMAEAGFHIGPELATPTLAGGGTLTGTYSYRVDLCRKNAQNEEIRSLSILTTSVVAAGQSIVLKIPTCMTRRTVNDYFLIYRNAMAAGVPLTNWWLLNSRDPASASFYQNDQNTSYITVTDTGAVTDAAIQNFELHPATSGDLYLQPVAAPACEIIAAGHDRLWVAGGEIAPGTVAPSRLFTSGDAPSFNPYLNIIVDRGFEAITAIGFTGNIKVIFRKNNAYILDGDGPDNVSNGLWEAPRLALADIGAVSQDSLALITEGLMFQSGAGIRVMSPSGNVGPGAPVDLVAKRVTVRGCIVANNDQEVRWYCEDRVLVYNYLYDAWSSWDFGCVGAGRLPNGLAFVARSDGTLWVETDGTWTDGPNTYTHRIRFPWLHGGNLGDFQRVRAIQGLGRFDGSTHNVHLDLYYDERVFSEESFDWVMPDTSSSNTDTWGAATWGAGVWGDTAAVANGLHDQTWEWVRRPNRQKCSVFSVAIDDNNTAGPGFVLTALGLALAKKSGLNRTPERGGTESTR